MFFDDLSFGDKVLNAHSRVILVGAWCRHFFSVARLPVCGGCVIDQVKFNLSNILSNIDDGNIADHRGPVKTVMK